MGNDDCSGGADERSEKYEGFPFLVDLLMQTQEQLGTAKGTSCSGTIISDHWVATSEECCENVAGAILDFTDDRTGDQGTGSTTSSTVAMPCVIKPGGGCRAGTGRKRRDDSYFFEFNKNNRTRRSTDDDHRDKNCHEHDFCIKNGICLMRARTNILRRAEIYGIPAKKLCMPRLEPIHGKQCWISGWTETKKRTPIELNMFNEGASNKWCIDHSDYTREEPPADRRRRSTAVLDADNNNMTIPDNLVCAGYPHEDETKDHSGDVHELTLAANEGFKPDRGGPIICKEPLDENDDTKGSILVFVGIAHSNMLSLEAGKPGLFTRIYNEKAWIQEKLTTWSDWTPCDHTCKSTRVRGCGFVDTSEANCENGLVIEPYTCTKANYTNGELPGNGEILQSDGVNVGCYPETENILPKSKIENNSLKMCDVKLARFRRELDHWRPLEVKETVQKESRIINGADIEPYSWPWLVRLNFLTQIQFNNIEGASKAGFKIDARLEITANQRQASIKNPLKECNSK